MKHTSALPTLDVVIPCYNEQDEIATCLDAVLIEKNDIHRIIVVDNNSTDETVKIVSRYARDHDIIELVQEPAQGIEYARDTGIATSQAEIVARIDADTRVRPGWARAIREFYAAHPDVAAGSGATEYYDLPFRRLTNIMTWLAMTVSNQLVANSFNLYGANMSVRVAAWKDIFDTLPTRGQHLMEDLSISLALQKHNYHLAYMPSVMAHVSGRRIRSGPKEFIRYNTRWPNTYRIMGLMRQARLITMVSWLGSILQIIGAFVLRFHNPTTMKFGVRHFFEGYEARPWL